MRYFDASALVKRYVRESSSASVRRMLADGPAATSRLSAVEITSALARRTREKALPAATRDRLLGQLTHDLPALLVIELTPELITRARALLLRHPLRSSDAIQLASALFLQEALHDVIAFVAFDQRLNAAAESEGLPLA